MGMYYGKNCDFNNSSMAFSTSIRSKIYADFKQNGYKRLARYIDPSDTSLQQKFFLCTVYQLMESGYVKETREPTKNSLGFIINNIDYLMNQSVIHKKALKRFAKEHIIDSIEPIILNPEGTKNKNAFMFYIIYLIGKYLENIYDIEQINQLIEKHLGNQNKEYTVNDDYSVILKERILKDEDYSAVLSQGARLIMDWE